MVVLTETWLTEDIIDSELGLTDYNLFRCDRSIFTSSKEDGGGALIAINKKFKIQKIIISNNSFEMLFIKIFDGDSFFVIGACYIPPNAKSEYYAELIECMQTSLCDILVDNANVKFLLVGDFNVPGYDWLIESNYSTARGFHPNVNFRDAAYFLSKWCKLYKLIQINSIKNIAGNILDLAFTNFYDAKAALSDEYLIRCDEAHSPVSISFSVQKIVYNTVDEIIFDYKHANFSEMANHLADINIPNIINNEISLNEFVLELENRFHDLVNKFVPTFRLKTRSFPRWFSNELIAAIINKKRSHKLYKQYKSQYYFHLFKKDRAHAKLLASRDEKAYLSSTEESIRNDSKFFFKYVNNLSSSNSIPSTLHLDGQTADNDRDIANLFAEKFSNVYCSDDLNYTGLPFEINDTYSNITLTIEDLEACIRNLKPSNSPGPDKIHPIIVIKCSNALKFWLLDLFNISLKLGIFPQCWKISFLSPLFKGGDPTDINNYRPINKYKVFAKMLDYMVFSKLYPYFRKYIIPNQHGFLDGRSTVTNLSVYSEFILENLNLGKVVDSIYIDFTRAFDLVNLNLLIKKLNAYGIAGTLLLWLDSYLNERRQLVKIKNSMSFTIEVLSGVGQGTHLGPLLFLMFINDVVHSIKYCEISLFADDTKLFKVIESPTDSLLLQQDICSFEEWCGLNGLRCNAKKCFVIRFGRSNTVPLSDYSINSNLLERVNNIRDLGVIFDSKMSFKYHIEYLDMKIRKKIYFIKRFSFKFKSISTFRTLYFSFVYSRLMYASTIWRPYERGLIKKIESLNTLFLRYAAFRTGNALHFTDHDFSSTYELFNISTLESARDRADIIFAFKIFSNSIDCSDLLMKFNFYIPPRRLRANNYYFSNPMLREGERRNIVGRLSKLCNDNAHWLDLYCSSLYQVQNGSRVLLRYM